MSLVVYDFFRAIPNVKLYYIPVNSSRAVILNGKREKFIQLPAIDLKTYLAAYGFKMHTCSKPIYPRANSLALFKAVTESGHPGNVAEIRNAGTQKGPMINKRHLSGEWFAEWLYYTIQSSWNLSDSHLAMNLELRQFAGTKSHGADNEIDLAFVINNKLHLVELKVYSGEITNNKIYAPMYKIAAIQRTLGLHAQTHVLILHPFGNSEERRRRVKARQNLLNIKTIWSLEDIINQSLDELIK